MSAVALRYGLGKSQGIFNNYYYKQLQLLIIDNDSGDKVCCIF